MSDISNKILKILKEYGISMEDIPTELYKIQQEIDGILWEKLVISPTVFYKLKDTIFFNFEHSEHTDNLTGKTSLKYFGTKYPGFLMGTGTCYINNEYSKLILEELEDIKSKWNNQIYIAHLHSKVDFDWIIGDDNPSTMIVYNKDNESPSKYGYYNNDLNGNSYGKIYGIDGNVIKRNQNIVLCAIKKIDLYREYSLLTQALDNLHNTIRNAVRYNKGVFLDFENVDYEN